MKGLLIGILLMVAQYSHADRLWAESFWISETESDNSIAEGKSVFRFIVNNAEIAANSVIMYSIDGINAESTLDSTRSFEIETIPGAHSFEILYDLAHTEIFINEIEISEKHRTTIILAFQQAQIQMNVRKPVIYLYPKSRQEIDVTLDVKGTLEFTYPPYKNGWKVTADPTGELTWNDKTFNYLFWESSQLFSTNEVEFNDGTFVRSEDLGVFFDRSLDRFGFNSQEKQDFITYWMPQMMNHSILYICYKFNEECDIFAELNIQPKPEQVLRLYLFWSVPESTMADQEFWPIQEIPNSSRDGFTVVEWGGAEIPSKN